MTRSIETEEKVMQAYNLWDSFEMVFLIVLNVIIHHRMGSVPYVYFYLANAGFLLVAYGLIINLYFGIHWRNYALGVVGSLFTAAVYAAKDFYPEGTEIVSRTFLWLPLWFWYLFAAGFFLMTTIEAYKKRKAIANAKITPVHWFKILVICLSIIYAAFLLFNLIAVLSTCGLTNCT